MTNVVDIAFKTQTFIPNFSGNSDEIESFIIQCDKFYNTYGRSQDNNLNNLVFSILKGKLQGAAFKKIACRAEIETWPEIRQLLLDNFSDHLTPEILKKELMYLIRNAKENYLQFLNKIDDLKSKILIKVAMNNQLNANQRENEKLNVEEIALQTLKMNIDDHLLTKLDIKEVTSINGALPIVTKHLYTYQNIQETKRILFKSQPSTPKLPTNNFIPNFLANNPTRFPTNTQINFPINNTKYTNTYQPRYNQLPNIPPSRFPGQSHVQRFESKPISNIRPNPNFQTQHFPTASKVFGKPITNVFGKKNFNKPNSFVERMSTTSAHQINNLENGPYQMEHPVNSDEYDNSDVANPTLDSADYEYYTMPERENMCEVEVDETVYDNRMHLVEQNSDPQNFHMSDDGNAPT